MTHGSRWFSFVCLFGFLIIVLFKLAFSCTSCRGPERKLPPVCSLDGTGGCLATSSLRSRPAYVCVHALSAGIRSVAVVDIVWLFYCPVVKVCSYLGAARERGGKERAWLCSNKRLLLTTCLSSTEVVRLNARMYVSARKSLCSIASQYHHRSHPEKKRPPSCSF